MQRFLKSLDDETLIRACASNKYYRDACDENFYRSIVKERHPEWEQFLNKYNNSYKKLFLTSIVHKSENKTVISKENKVVTLVNVFTVKPERQQELVDLLVEATEKTMKNIPGFVSANIHKSLDGVKVVNYAQWESKEAFENMLQNPEAKVHMGKAASIATSFEPHLYEVSSVHHNFERSDMKKF